MLIVGDLTRVEVVTRVLGKSRLENMVKAAGGGREGESSWFGAINKTLPSRGEILSCQKRSSLIVRQIITAATYYQKTTGKSGLCPRFRIPKLKYIKGISSVCSPILQRLLSL